MSPTITSSSYSNSQSLLPLISPQQRIYSDSKRPLSSHDTEHNLSEYSSSTALAITKSDYEISSDPPSNQPYTIVRDFAYPTSHPMHYGTMIYSSQPSSGLSTPASQSPVFLSDPLDPWDNNSCWGSRSYGEELIEGEQVAQINFGDGPPWSEDEDLQSPVVVSSRHRKYKSSGSSCGEKRRPIKESEEKMNCLIEPTSYEHNGRYFLSSSENDCKRFYVSQDEDKGGPRSEIIAYSTEKARHFDRYDLSNRRDSHFAGTLPKRSYADVIRDFSGPETSSTASSPVSTPREESRYSRDYQFTITSSDEEMHGKAVALFDFKSENENELPLIEGQVIWVSYRYGEGWLVAEDPKSRESGLVPEAYVRLLRDIHGDLGSTTGHVNDLLNPFEDSGTQSSSEYGRMSGKISNNYDYHAPIVSTFSTSSKDLNPYPHYLLATYAGQAPPQVIHYQGQRGGSQINTPTNLIPSDNNFSPSNDESLCPTPIATYLPLTDLDSSKSVEQNGNHQPKSNEHEVGLKIFTRDNEDETF
ncbi:hypothetical protein EPUL_006846 [Erysiphe pulchra]|uniref:SH3 domain-containing protein n=1 Tax=Erysiphe pulchra TaxID=225359 RepID=A0A2S4PR44_9PEZI|nr:hypothetical protein EPUL_006846 [Erysiphe pulchra]